MIQMGQRGINGGIKIRNAVPKDCHNILTLFNDVFKKDRSEIHWKWKFINNPTRNFLAVVAEDNDKIVGQYATLPVWMTFNGSKTLGALELDSMVHPNYRRRGLFIELANKCFERAASENIKLLYGIPNEQNLRYHVGKLGHRNVGMFPRLVRVLNPYEILKRKTKSAILASVLTRPTLFFLKSLPIFQTKRLVQHTTDSQVITVNRFDTRFDVLWGKVLKSLTISLWKDSIYLNWRYIQCPDTNYIVFAVQEDDAVNGFLVLKIEESEPPRRPYKTGYIVDFLCIPEKSSDGKLLISSSLQYLRDNGVNVAFCWSSERSLLHILFRSLGFLKYGDSGSLLYLSTLPNTDASIINNIHNWQLEPGDMDFF